MRGKRIVIPIVVLCAVVASASAGDLTWYGVAPYLGPNNLVLNWLEDGNLDPWRIQKIALSFTAPSSVTTAGVYLDLQTLYGVPACTINVYDDAAGDPDTALLSDQAFTVTSTGEQAVLFNSAVSLTAGEVYHVVIEQTNQEWLTGPKFGVSVNFGGPDAYHGGGAGMAAQVNRNTYTGYADEALAARYWDGSAWAEAMPDTATKIADPRMALINEDNTGILTGLGFGMASLGSNINMKAGIIDGAENFVFQPEGYSNGDKVLVKAMSMCIKKFGTGGGELKFRIYDSTGTTVLADADIDETYISTAGVGSNVLAPINDGGVYLTVGTRYVAGAYDPTGQTNTTSYWQVRGAAPGTYVPGPYNGFQGIDGYRYQKHYSTGWAENLNADMLVNFVVPEPATLALLIMGGIGVAVRRRR